MQPQQSSIRSTDKQYNSVKLLLREAKRLHKSSQSESLSIALPVLRRLIVNKVLTGISLSELWNNSKIVQRKHILTLLAKESGFKHWAEFKKIIEQSAEDKPVHYALALSNVGYPNLWFSTLKEANDYTAIYSGQAIQVGDQAVVINVESPESD